MAVEVQCTLLPLALILRTTPPMRDVGPTSRVVMPDYVTMDIGCQNETTGRSVSPPLRRHESREKIVCKRFSSLFRSSPAGVPLLLWPIVSSHSVHVRKLHQMRAFSPTLNIRRRGHAPIYMLQSTPFDTSSEAIDG